MSLSYWPYVLIITRLYPYVWRHMSSFFLTLVLMVKSIRPHAGCNASSRYQPFVHVLWTVCPYANIHLRSTRHLHSATPRFHCHTAILLMVWVQACMSPSPYVILRMVWMHSPYMLFSICYSPHGLSECVLVLDIMSPYATLHMVWVHVSSHLSSCLHMLFSIWFALHSPHAWNYVSICYSPHGWHGILLMP